MGKPHTSHPITEPHRMVYEITWALWKKNFQHMKFRRMKNQCLQDEGVDYSSHCMRAFVWDFEGSQRVP